MTVIVIKDELSCSAVVVRTLISALGKQRQVDLCEFEASLVYKS